MILKKYYIIIESFLTIDLFLEKLGQKGLNRFWYFQEKTKSLRLHLQLMEVT